MLAGLLLACAMLAAPSRADVDLVADRVFLRTQVNGGDEITSPQVGQQVFFHLAYHLSGATMSMTGQTRALIDGQQQCGGMVAFSTGDGALLWCPDAWTATAGTHVLRWELDGGNNISESNENNNSAVLVFTVGAPTVDLIAGHASLRTQANGGDEVDAPSPGQHLYFQLSYQVAGITVAVPARVRALIDGQEQCAGPVDFTAGGSSTVFCSDAWTATAGTHVLRWEIDPDNTVAETNESNNVTVLAFTVGSASVDLVAARAYLRTAANGGDEVASPVANQPVFPHLAYRLDGVSAVIPGQLHAFIDDEPQCDGPVDFSPNGGIIWCSQPWVATAGQHRLRWEIAFDDAVAETNPDNNSATFTFIVTTTATADLIAKRAFLRTQPNGGVEVTNPQLAQQVFPHAAFRLTGVSAVQRLELKAAIDGQPQCEGPVDFGPGDGFVWCDGSWTATAGTHRLHWELDAGHALEERDETNNVVDDVFGVGGPAGDANCDARLGAADIVALLQHVAAGTRAACGRDDANANQTLDSGDPAALLAELFMQP